MVNTRKSRLRKKFQYDKNRKKAWKQSKKLPVVKSDVMRGVWQNDKSIEVNLQSMGLVADPNRMFKINAKDTIEFGSLKRGPNGEMEVDTDKPFVAKNVHVAETLEADASVPRKKSIALSRPVAEVIGYFLATHGDPTLPEVKAAKSTEKSILMSMARDRRNFDQLTPKQIKRKILAFKRVPEYVEEYYTNRKK